VKETYSKAVLCSTAAHKAWVFPAL